MKPNKSYQENYNYELLRTDNLNLPGEILLTPYAPTPQNGQIHPGHFVGLTLKVLIHIF